MQTPGEDEFANILDDVLAHDEVELLGADPLPWVFAPDEVEPDEGDHRFARGTERWDFERSAPAISLHVETSRRRRRALALGGLALLAISASYLIASFAL